MTKNNGKQRGINAKPSPFGRGQGEGASIPQCRRCVSLHPLAFLIVITLHPLAGLAQPPPTAAPSDSTTIAQLERTFQEAIAHAEPSVVAISRITPPTPAASNDSGNVVGAGVIIDPAGLVLTQYLNVHDGEQHFVTTTDRATYPATIRAADARSGLAVLAINTASPLQRAGEKPKTTPTTFPTLPFGDADTLKKGQFVIAIGNPFAIKADGEPTASWGIVTNLAQKAPVGTNLNEALGLANDYRTTVHHLGTLIQTDAKLGWSTGGGALINLRGELVGVTTTAATIPGHEKPAGYAIPINAAFQRIINRLKEGREVEYGMLGVGFGQLVLGPQPVADSRLTLQQVFGGGPAARAGLQVGDTLDSISGSKVKDVDEIQLAVSLMSPASTTAIGYTRNGRPGTTKLTLAKLAAVGKNVVSVPPESWRGMRVDYATALDALTLGQAIASGAYDAAGCVLVAAVEEKSEAWNAGVRKGMFVSHVGKQRVSTPAEFFAAARDVGKAFDVQLTKPVEANEEPASKPE